MAFKNPYIDASTGKFLPGLTLHRLQVPIPKDDYKFIKLLRSDQSTITTTVNIVWQRLVQFIKDNGINTYAQQSEFESLIDNLGFVDLRKQPNGNTAERSSTERPHEAVGRGATVVRSIPPEQASEHAVMAGGTERRGRGTKNHNAKG